MIFDNGVDYEYFNLYVKFVDWMFGYVVMVIVGNIVFIVIVGVSLIILINFCLYLLVIKVRLIY